MKYTPSEIQKWDMTGQKLNSNLWVPLRSLNHEYESLFSRIKNAWGVLTGKYDVLEWEC